MDQGVQTISAKTLSFPARQGSAPRGKEAQISSSIFRRSLRAAGFSPARGIDDQHARALQKTSRAGEVA